MHDELANTSARRRIRNLAIVHVAFGIIAALSARIELPAPSSLPHILIVPLIASVACQAVLFAFWAVNWNASHFLRAGALAGAAVYLEALMANIATGELFGVGIATLVATSVSLLTLRRFGIGLVRHVDSRQPDQRLAVGLQFSIRGLMLVTAVAAILIVGAQTFRAGPAGPHRVNPVLGLCFTSVGLVALWAGLGHARPLVRAPVLILLAMSLGAYFAFAANAHAAGWIYIMLTMLLFSTGLLASLLVIRTRGYHFGKFTHEWLLC
jgi:hypothetical protein